MVEVRPPRLEHFGPMTLWGLSRSHDPAQDNDDLHRAMVRQWDEFLALPRQPPTYGVFLRMADGDLKLDYFCGNAATRNQSPELTSLDVPALYCAVFHQVGHVSEMRPFTQLVFGTVLPMAGLEPAADGPGVPEFIERYGVKFDHAARAGEFELLVPVKP